MEKSTTIGRLAGLTAGACWGLVYVLPLFLTNFSPAEIALGRYFVFGLVALLSVGSARRLPRSVWSWGLCFALIGNILYYASCVMAIKLASATTVTMLYALVPVLITLYSRTYDSSIPLRVILPPLFGIVVGTMLTNFQPATDLSEQHLKNSVWGISFALVCMLLWTWYAVQSSRFLQSRTDVSAKDLLTTQGICCLVLTLLFAIGMTLIVPQEIYLLSPYITPSEMITFLIIVLLLGAICTWLATFCWSITCKHLPISTTAQLASTEIVFGLVYIFTYENRLPHIMEIIGIFVIVTALILSERNCQKWKNEQLQVL